MCVQPNNLHSRILNLETACVVVVDDVPSAPYNVDPAPLDSGVSITFLVQDNGEPILYCANANAALFWLFSESSIVQTM